MNRFLGRNALLLALLVTTGCWYHRIEVPTPATIGTEYESAVMWSFFWGAGQKNERQPQNCGAQGLKEVRVSSNLAFALLTVVTVGLVAPERVQWKCAAPVQNQEGVVPPEDES